MNDATSTKQEVNGATGLVVMSNVPSVDTYWHGDLSLGSAPPAVTADFTSSPATGGTPLAVSFHDASANLPTNWRWDFGDGHVSVGRDPLHIYTAPGTYTVRLTAANASSSATVVRPAAVTVVGPPSPPGDGGAVVAAAPPAGPAARARSWAPPRATGGSRSGSSNGTSAVIACACPAPCRRGLPASA